MLDYGKFMDKVNLGIDELYFKIKIDVSVYIYILRVSLLNWALSKFVLKFKIENPFIIRTSIFINRVLNIQF